MSEDTIPEPTELIDLDTVKLDEEEPVADSEETSYRPHRRHWEPEEAPQVDVVSDEPISKIGQAMRWKSRRQMTWLALIAMIAVTLLLMYTIPVGKLGALELVIIWFYGAMTSIVGAYFGFRTWANVKDPRGR